MHQGIGASGRHVMLSEFDLHPSQTAIFIESRGLTVRLISGKDISNGYVTSLFWVTQCGIVNVSNKSRKRMETAHNLLRKVNVIFFFQFIGRTPRLGR